MTRKTGATSLSQIAVPIAVWFAFASLSGAQTAPADQQTSAPPAPAPLPTPSITGPLQAAPPNTFDAGPFGKLSVNGIVSGMGLWQGNHVPGDDPTQAALSNGQVFLQKTTGWWQFYVQAGAYNIRICLPA